MKHPRGTTLVEIMIALMVLSLGLVMVISSFTASVRLQGNAANRLIALNLAREGLEAMRNIRDTNWLVNSGNKRECWNYSRAQITPSNWEPNTDDGNWSTASKCEKNNPSDDVSSNPILSGYYAVQPELTQTMAWILGDYKELDVENELQDEAIVDFLNEFNSVDDLNDVDSDLYEYVLFPIATSAPQLASTYVHPGTQDVFQDELNIQESPVFFRQIRIRYLCDEPSYSDVSGSMTELVPEEGRGISDYPGIDFYPSYDDTDCRTLKTPMDAIGRIPEEFDDVIARDDNRMEVMALVKWYEGGRMYEVRLMTHLTDWRDRTDHDA